MSTEIVAHPPLVRCYLCGRAEVDKVCHHCGRSICSQDRSEPIPVGRTVQNPEFTDLGLGHTAVGQQGVHCRFCVHYVRSFKWLIVVGAVVAVVGLVVLLLAVTGAVGARSLMGMSREARSVFGTGLACGGVGLLSMLAGIGVIALGIYLQRARYRRLVIESRPPLPVVGNIQTISLTESIRGRITLDAAGHYTAQAEQPRGTLTLAFHFAQGDRDRLGAYLKKYGLAFSDEIPFRAGFVTLQGSANIGFDDPRVVMPGRANTIVLEGRVGEQPFLRGVSDGQSYRWTIRYPYTILVGEGDAFSLPVQIVPTLVREGARRAVELIVQVPMEVRDVPAIAGQARAEELSLRAPQSLGKIEFIDPPGLIGQGAEATGDGEIAAAQVITWKGVTIGAGRPEERRKSFYVRFENTVESTTVLNGRLRVRFDDTLSGLSGVRLFYPLGNERKEKVDVQRHTYIDVDFSLDLGGLRFQEPTMVTGRLVRSGVVPDYHMVTALTNALSAEEFYVKRVIENPPRTSKTGAHITNRYWDVAGRFYTGVYPIDFHLVLTGEEVYGGAGRAYSGKTQIDVTVQGTVTDEEMRKQVEYLKDRLLAIVDNTLDTLPEAAIEEAPVVAVEDVSALEAEVEEFPPVPLTPAPPIVTDRAAVLRMRLDKLDEALLEGRISEARYEEMRARIEQEMAGLSDEK